MKILFDQGTPVPLRTLLVGHEVSTAFEMGWSKLDNGNLLAAAESSFDVFVTTDQSLPYQQNLSGRRLGILVLPTTSWLRIQKQSDRIMDALETLRAGGYVDLVFEP
jgi:hypothetical protein